MLEAQSKMLTDLRALLYTVNVCLCVCCFEFVFLIFFCVAVVVEIPPLNHGRRSISFQPFALYAQSTHTERQAGRPRQHTAKRSEIPRLILAESVARLRENVFKKYVWNVEFLILLPWFNMRQTINWWNKIFVLKPVCLFAFHWIVR